MAARPDPTRGRVFHGVLYLLGLHFVFQSLFLWHASVYPPGILYLRLIFVGGNQMLYVLPAYLLVSSMGRTQTAKGLLIGFGWTVLLNTMLFALSLMAMFGPH